MPKPKKDLVTPYQQTPMEAQALQDIHARHKAKAPVP
jgi:hypothetical protein